MADLDDRVSPQDFTPPIEEGVVNNAPAQAIGLFSKVVDKMDEERALDAFNKALKPIIAGEDSYGAELRKLSAQAPGAGPALAELTEKLQSLKLDQTDEFIDPSQAAVLKADLLRSYIARYPRYAQLFQKLGNAETNMGKEGGGGGGGSGDKTLDALENIQVKAIEAGLTVPEYISLERQNAQLALEQKRLTYEKDFVEHTTRFAYQYADASFRVVSQQTLTQAFQDIKANSELFGKMTPEAREAYINTKWVPQLSIEMATILQESQQAFGAAFTQAQQQELRMQQNEIEQLMRQVAKAEDPIAEMNTTIKAFAFVGAKAAIEMMPMLRWAGDSPQDILNTLSKAHAYINNPNNEKWEMVRQGLLVKASEGDYAARIALEYFNQLRNPHEMAKLFNYGIKLGALPPVPGNDPNVTAAQRDLVLRFSEKVTNPEGLARARQVFFNDMSDEGFKRMAFELKKPHVRASMVSRDNGEGVFMDSESTRWAVQQKIVDLARQGIDFVYPELANVAIPKSSKWTMAGTMIAEPKTNALGNSNVLGLPIKGYAFTSDGSTMGYAPLSVQSRNLPNDYEVQDKTFKDYFTTDKTELYGLLESWNAHYYFLHSVSPERAETFRKQTLDAIRAVQANIKDWREFVEKEKDNG